MLERVLTRRHVRRPDPAPMLEQALSLLSESPLSHCDIAKRESLNRSFSDFTVPAALLDRGLISPGKPAQWMRFANRLRAHEAVSILSIGSSLVATAAGCNKPLPVLWGCECPKCCGTFCGAVCRSQHNCPSTTGSLRAHAACGRTERVAVGRSSYSTG